MVVRFISNQLFSKWLWTTVLNNQQVSILRRISNYSVVTVQQGKLKGSLGKLLDGSNYYSFKGIPYAAPPVGKLRFKAPLPPVPWKDVYDATEHKGMCPQYDMITTNLIPGDEDCLFLNIYSKDINTRKPVIIFIHGGAYMSGSGNTDVYGPEYLIQHDVVLVTFNYRLEVLGFLCLDTEDVPGNAGMKDQVAVLNWVKKNIANFGGDPNNVTLAGESAGAAAVTFHMVSPLSKKLFHKAIIQSGVCLSDWARGTKSIERAFRLTKLLGKETKDINEVYTYLQTVPAENLAKVTFKTMDYEEKCRGLPIHFCPVVEKKFKNNEPFLDEEAINLFLANKSQDIPIIFGYNNGEGVPMNGYFIDKLDFYNKKIYYKIPREIANKVNSKEKMIEFADQVRQFYFKGCELTREFKNEMASLDSDIFFIYNILRFVHIYQAGAKNPTYMYKLAYDTEVNLMKKVTGCTDFKGAVHADDLFYLFSSEMTKDLAENDVNAMNKINEITKMWTNFAKTGNPTPDDTLGFKWKPFTTKSKNYLNMGSTTTLEANPDRKNIEFWNKLYCEAGLPCITKSNL